MLARIGQQTAIPTTTGNWTQQDALNALNAPLDPNNANRYAYAADNPINNTDPSGRGIFSDILGGALAAVGVAVGALAISTGVGEIAAAATGAEAIVGSADIGTGGVIGSTSIFARDEVGSS
ncbi:hypothetical protein [uncultured Jatrophihabitans sp.]|uniref:hypothetical protein n=1 Tax=uncultured Jatrophihabitans sp. TaxID=1610747 RepID=UPI0035CBBBAB